MKSALTHALFFLFEICVFGDEVKAEIVSVIEGDSVTLLTGVTRIQRDELIEWRLNGYRIAKISGGIISTEGPFRDRLKLDPQSGDLKITNIKTTDSGEYTLNFTSPRGSSEKTFSVSDVSTEDLGLNSEILHLLSNQYERTFPNGDALVFFQEDLATENPGEFIPETDGGETPRSPLDGWCYDAAEREDAHPPQPLAVYFEDISPVSSPVSPREDALPRGVKRLRYYYGEYDSDTGEQLTYPNKEQESDPCTSTTRGYPRCSKTYKKRPRLETESDEEDQRSVEIEEDEVLDYDDEDLEIYLASQDSAIDGAFSEATSPAGSSISDDGDYRPLYSAREADTVRDDTLRATSRQFSRILEAVSDPLTYQQTEDLVYGAQREATGLMRSLIEIVLQLTTELRSAVVFFQENYNRLEETVRYESSQVRSDQQTSTIALSLFSERLNIIQRQLTLFMRR